MAIPTFTLGYPQNNSSLGNSKAPIRNNIDGTFQAFSVDHTNQNGVNVGYHNVIHQETQGSPPAAIVGINQVFAMVPPSNIPSNGDVQLFSLTGGGGLSQLTGNSQTSNGFCWLGGVLMQWGYSTDVYNVPTAAISFPETFPNAVLNIQVTYIVTDNTTLRSGVMNGTITTSGFTWIGTESEQLIAIYWMAIGY